MIHIGNHSSQPSRFSRQWWLGGLRNFLFVAIVSLLIWVYADMDVTEDKDFRATILLTLNDARDLVLLTENRTEAVFELRGTRSVLGLFQRELDEAGSQIPYDVSVGYGPGVKTVRTEDILNRALGLSRRGLSLLSASPTQISFTLDQRVRRAAKVELDATGAKLVGEPKIEPDTISVRLAKSDLDAMNLPEGEPIRLKTRRLDLRTVPAGRPYTTELDVLPPPNTRHPVILDVKTVKATLQIDQRTDQKTLRVAVQVLFPYTWTEDDTWQEYLLVKKDPLEWQPQITVQGAKTDVESLKPEDVDAHVTLSEADKTPVGSWLPGHVTVNFPPGKDLQLLGPPPTVNFKLEKRPASPPAPPTPVP